MLLIVGALIFLISCTDNARARKFGGTETIEIGPNQIVLGTDWKGDELWVLIQDTITHESFLQENSSFGLVEGKIKFKSKQ